MHCRPPAQAGAGGGAAAGDGGVAGRAQGGEAVEVRHQVRCHVSRVLVMGPVTRVQASITRTRVCMFHGRSGVLDAAARSRLYGSLAQVRIPQLTDNILLEILNLIGNTYQVTHT